MRKCVKRYIEPSAIGFVAFVARFAWVLHVLPSRRSIDYSAASSGDTAVYLELARSLRQWSFSLGGVPSHFRGPGYPAFLALVPHDLAAIYCAQAVVGAATAALTCKLAQPFGRRVAIAAGLAMAIAPYSIFFVTEIMTETLYTFLVILGCVLWRRPCWSGFVFGLSWLVRPTTMVFLLFALLVVFLLRRERKRVALITLAAVLTILPWTVRNILVFHRPIPVAVSGLGTNLMSGSLDFTFGKDVWPKWFSEPLLQTGYQLGTEESDKILLRRGLSRIANDPLLWLKNRARQYPWLWIDTGVYIHTSLKWFFVIGNALLLLLGVIGIVAYWRELQIVMFPAFIILFHLPLWVEPRYSLPAIPFLIILAILTVRGCPARYR